MMLAEERNRAIAMRRDIVPQEQPDVVKAVDVRLKSLHASKTHRTLATDLDKAQQNRERFMIRRTLLEPPKSDPNGLERTIGRSDLLTINFLTHGTHAASGCLPYSRTKPGWRMVRHWLPGRTPLVDDQ